MQGFEFDILYFLQGMRSPLLDEIMQAITSLGDQGFFFLLLGIVLLTIKKTRRIGVTILLSIIIGFLLGNVILKNLIARDRPCWIDPNILLLIPSPSDYSFPSGHTLVAFEAALSIFFFHKKWGIAMIAVAILIGISRMYLFVHFPSDVVAGAILGGFIAWGVSFFVKRFYKEDVQV